MVTIRKGVVTVMKRMISLLLSLVMLSGVILPVYGAEEIPTAEATLDGEAMDVTAYLYDGVSYFPLEETVKCFFPEAEVSCENGIYTAQGENFTMTVEKGKTYFEINGRYLYVPGGFKTRESDGMVMVPARPLGRLWDLVWTGKRRLSLPQKALLLPRPISRTPMRSWTLFPG